jgi:hypothetical protein
MKTLTLAILALALPLGAAHAQSLSCRNLGTSTYCDNGWSARQMGNDTYITPPPPAWMSPTYQPTSQLDTQQPNYQPFQPSHHCRQMGNATYCN